MRLDFDTDQTAIRDAIAAALKSATSDRLRGIWRSGYLDHEYRSLGEMGMFGFVAGEPLDAGTDVGPGGAVEACILAEQLGLHAAVTPALTSIVQVAGALRTVPSHAGSYRDLVAAEQIWSWAHLEAAARPDRLPALRAIREGDGLVLTGEKAFVEWGTVAQRFVVTAAVQAEPVVVLVAPDARGVRVSRRVTNTGGELTRVDFDGTPVAPDAIVARGEAATAMVDATWKRTLLFQSAYLAGVGRRAIELTIAHAKVREQFGRPLGTFQAVKHALADAHSGLLAARLMVFEAASRAGYSTALPALASTKAWVSEATTQALRVAHEIHGGLGAVDDHEVTLLFRRALAETQLYGSASELWELAAEARAGHRTGERRSAH